MIAYRVERLDWDGRFRTNEMGVHFAENPAIPAAFMSMADYNLYDTPMRDGVFIEADIPQGVYLNTLDVGHFTPDELAQSLNAYYSPGEMYDTYGVTFDEVFRALDGETERRAMQNLMDLGFIGISYLNWAECRWVPETADCMTYIIFDPSDIRVRRIGTITLVGDTPSSVEQGYGWHYTVEYEITWAD
jgi:hypothetical protein